MFTSYITLTMLKLCLTSHNAPATEADSVAPLQMPAISQLKRVFFTCPRISQTTLKSLTKIKYDHKCMLFLLYNRHWSTVLTTGSRFDVFGALFCTQTFQKDLQLSNAKFPASQSPQRVTDSQRDAVIISQICLGVRRSYKQVKFKCSNFGLDFIPHVEKPGRV